MKPGCLQNELFHNNVIPGRGEGIVVVARGLEVLNHGESIEWRGSRRIGTEQRAVHRRGWHGLDTQSWVKGNHTIKMGGNFQRAYTNSIRNDARTGLTVGYFAYYTAYCGGTCNNGYLNGDPVQNDVEELLLGKADLADRSFGDTHRHITQNSVGFYAQDDWKIKPRFTLNYGLRYEINGTLRDTNNNEAVFIPPPGGAGLVKVGQGIGGIHKPRAFPHRCGHESVAIVRLSAASRGGGRSTPRDLG